MNSVKKETLRMQLDRSNAGRAIIKQVYIYIVLALIVLVSISPNFDADWFLDGRRKKPGQDYIIPSDSASTSRAMGASSPGKGDSPIG